MNVFWIVLPLLGLFLGWTIRWLYARFQLSSAEQRAVRVVQEAVREAEVKKKEVLLETKDELLREKNQLERETRDRRGELQKMERRVLSRQGQRGWINVRDCDEDDQRRVESGMWRDGKRSLHGW